ncbi:hypothetical protein [Methylorubrum thiocyanatum]|uniref:hypothetical protein n=1 Tax=Methylorubrum thiocyanatum TaxID=47958 RepID=UPI00398C3C5F
MSEHVLHVVRGRSADESYGNVISILGGGRLLARNPFGAAREVAPDPSSQNCVCFSEIPVELIGRVIERRLPSDRSSWHGVAFTKAFLVGRGGGPIMYAYDGTPQAEALRTLMDRARLSVAIDDPVWRLTPFVDLPGRHGSYYFEWEREWRHVGDLAFGPEDVAFILMPEEFHEAARCFFDEALREHTGPAYFCPFLDASWSRARCEQALARGPARPSGSGAFLG